MRNKILLFLACMALLCSCSEERELLQHEAGRSVRADIQLSVDSRIGGDTRSQIDSETIDALDIKDLWILQFGTGGEIIGTPTYIQDVERDDNRILKNAVTLSAVECTLWFVANTGSSSMFSGIGTLDEFKGKTFNTNNTNPELSMSVGIGGKNYLRMSGSWEGTITNIRTDFISVTMNPLAAKLSINYRIVGGDAWFTAIQVYNVPTSMRFSTTPGNRVDHDGGESSDDSHKTGLVAATADVQAEGGAMSFYVTENITNIQGNCTAAKDKNKLVALEKNKGAMYVQFEGKYRNGDKEVPFNIKLYPGSNTDEDFFNVQINHEYQINLNLDATDIENWVGDSRINTEFGIPYAGTDHLLVWYEFDPGDLTMNSMYRKDGTTALFNTDDGYIPSTETTTEQRSGKPIRVDQGKFIRNLAGDGDTYCAYRGEYDTNFKDDGTGRYQKYTAGNKYMEYSGLAFDTGYGGPNGGTDKNNNDEVIHPSARQLGTDKAFTIIFVGGFGRENTNGCMPYGVFNGGYNAAGSSRWYLYVSSASYGVTDKNNVKKPIFRYGAGNAASRNITGYDYVYSADNPQIFFCADRCILNGSSSVREIMVDGVNAQSLKLDKTFSFASNFYLGNNAYENQGFSSTGTRLYLFLIYDHTLTSEEISQVQAYARSKGYVTQPGTSTIP